MGAKEVTSIEWCGEHGRGGEKTREAARRPPRKSAVSKVHDVRVNVRREGRQNNRAGAVANSLTR